jgi:hypothetical protein
MVAERLGVCPCHTHGAYAQLHCRNPGDGGSVMKLLLTPAWLPTGSGCGDVVIPLRRKEPPRSPPTSKNFSPLPRGDCSDGTRWRDPEGSHLRLSTILAAEFSKVASSRQSAMIHWVPVTQGSLLALCFVLRWTSLGSLVDVCHLRERRTGRSCTPPVHTWKMSSLGRYLSDTYLLSRLSCVLRQVGHSSYSAQRDNLMCRVYASPIGEELNFV